MQHMNECGIENKDLDIEVLNCVMKGGFQLSVMEVSFICELKPALNTHDKYRDH